MNDVFANLKDDCNNQMICLLPRFVNPRQVAMLISHSFALEVYSAKGARHITKE